MALLRNFLIFLAAFLIGCFAAALVVANGFIAKAALLGAPIDQSLRLTELNPAATFALGTIAIAIFIVACNIVPAVIGFLANGLKSPSAPKLCVVAGGLYGAWCGLFLEGFLNPSGDALFLYGMAMWGAAGAAGGAIFSAVVRNLERSLLDPATT